MQDLDGCLVFEGTVPVWGLVEQFVKAHAPLVVSAQGQVSCLQWNAAFAMLGIGEDRVYVEHFDISFYLHVQVAPH